MPPLDTAALQALATAAASRQTDRQRPCEACQVLHCPGWEALPPGFDADTLTDLGSLCAEPDAFGNTPEPDLSEYHPAGTRFWSADAPIAPAFHPYNRCTVAACVACGRAFLRYTEYGGYYVEPRIRELNAALIVEAIDADYRRRSEYRAAHCAGMGKARCARCRRRHQPRWCRGNCRDHPCRWRRGYRTAMRCQQ